MGPKERGKGYTIRAGAAAALALLLLFVIVSGAGDRVGVSFADPGEGPTPEPISNGGDTGGAEEGAARAHYSGICPVCYTEVDDPEQYVECRNCFEFVLASGPEFVCGSCGAELRDSDYSDNERWLYHSYSECESLVWLLWFVSYNNGEGQAGRFEQEQIKTVRIKGWFDRDGAFQTSPWYTSQAPPSSLTANIGGEYAVYVYDAAGERLAVARFDAADESRAISEDGMENPMGSAIPVEIVVRFDERAAKIDIMDGSREVYSRKVSAHAPEVAFVEAGEYIDNEGRRTVAWEASDADGDELYFELWYCRSDAEYYLLANEIQGRSFEADLTAYPGSESGFFHIYATDGVRAAEAKSPKFSVEYNAPTILTGQDGVPKVKITEEINFPVEIYDAQDGRLTGDSVRWILEGEEVSITAMLQTWPYQLEPGLHTFTCIATNSAGVSAQKDFSFEIIDDESDLPDDWSRPEIVHALKNGYVAPLARIESPIPRGQYADLMFMLFYYINPDGLPYYDKDLITDCGDDDYSEFMMAYLGIMEAPGGLFEPHKSMAQQEGLRIMYLTWKLASEPGAVVKDIVYSEREALDLFSENGIFDKSENIYQPDEKLSKKSALVWASRMDRWVFPD